MYIPRRAARNFGRALDEGDPIAVGFAVGTSIIMGGVLLIIPILAISSCNKKQEAIKAVNTQLLKDLNEKTNANLQSFTTNKIIIESTDSKFIIKFNGVAIDSEQSYNASSVTYRLTENNFEKIKDVAYDDKNTENGDLDKNIGEYSSDILFKILEVLKESEFLTAEINNVEIIKNSEIAVEVGKPRIDEKNGKVSYALSLTKLSNNNLKMAWYKVSAELNEELKENPDLIYGMSKNDVTANKIDEINQTGVEYIYKQKDSYFAAPML